MELRLDLKLPRDAVSVPVVRRLLDTSLGVLGVKRPIREDIKVMLTEACGNVIRHADDGEDYTVSASVVEHRCVIQVIDSGGGFPAVQLSEVAPSAEHGRGMMIMKALADDVRFSTLPHQGALVAMEKHLDFGEDTYAEMLSHSPH